MIAFTRLSGNACRWTSRLRDRCIPFPVDDVNYLDYQVLQWHKQVPSALMLDMNELQTTQQQPIETSKKASLFLPAVLHARTNQLRNLIYRAVLYSPTRIAENKSHAQIAVDIARNSVQFLSTLNRATNFVSEQPIFFKHFLISAFAAILLAAANAPADFSHQVSDEFYLALDLFRSLSSRSPIMARIWEMIKIFETSGPKLGLTRTGKHSERDNNSNSDKTAHCQPTNDQIDNGNMTMATDQAATGPSPTSSWYPLEQHVGGAFFDAMGAAFSTSSMSAQLRNELSVLSGPMGDLSSHMFDGTEVNNLDTSTYWQ